MSLRSSVPVTGYWRPPVSGWLKLNTDGSSLGNPGPSSYGGLIRDDRGAWIIFLLQKFAAESWGISMRLRLIRAMEFKKVVIETDCQTALLLITVDNVDDSHPQSLLINDCRRDLQELGCYMVYVKRDGNRCADHMAKLGGRQNKDFVVVDHPPTMLTEFLEADAAAI